MRQSFLQYQHPHYSAQQARWSLVRDAYTLEGGMRERLLQHKQGESSTSFEERKALAQFPPLLASVVDSLAGMLFQHPAERDWGFMGSAETPGTSAYRLSRDADGRGTNYETMLRKAAIDVVLYQELWVLVDGERVRLLPPQSVTNWFESGGTLTAAVVKEVADTRTSITDEPGQVDQYVVYTPDGWTRYQDKSGTPVQVGSGTYSESGRGYVGRDGEPALPLFRVELPWRRYVAHQLAESARGLYNQQSERDHLLRVAAFPKLVIAADDDFFQAQVEALRKGSNVLQQLEEFGQHSYIAAPTGSIDAATAAIESGLANFFRLAWDLVSLEGSVQKTATEIAATRSAGVAAALAIISSVMEDLDSEILFRLAQALSPRESDWMSVHTTWPSDYAGVSIEAPEPPAS